MVNNGLVIFRVEQLEGSNALCRVVAGGELSDRKSMNFPNRVLAQAFLSQQDREDLLFGIQNGVDFVAASLCVQSSGHGGSADLPGREWRQ